MRNIPYRKQPFLFYVLNIWGDVDMIILGYFIAIRQSV